VVKVCLLQYWGGLQILPLELLRERARYELFTMSRTCLSSHLFHALLKAMF
jgi:hypothetical protein